MHLVLGHEVCLDARCPQTELCPDSKWMAVSERPSVLLNSSNQMTSYHNLIVIILHIFLFSSF